jgi:hypothetical protein
MIRNVEESLQRMAGEIASGILSEKLTPSDLMNKTEYYINNLRDSAAKSKEYMIILKPEKAYTAIRICDEFTQTLKTFRDILLQDSPDPSANSRLAFEQLRKALTDGSDLLFLMRDVNNNPSPLIDALITLKKASEAKGPVISIQASEEVQPLIKNVLGHIDELRSELIGLEKNLGEMKKTMRNLQQESLELLSEKASPATDKREDQESGLSQVKLTDRLDDS